MKENAQKKFNETRSTNVILYRVPENASSEEGESGEEKQVVEKLLAFIDPNVKAKKFYRLGKINTNEEGSRPIKVELENQEAQAKIIKKAHKLKDAPEELKNIGVSYDMSQNQRTEMKSLLKEASDMSKNSIEHVFKVRGAPGQMEIVKYQRKSQEVTN